MAILLLPFCFLSIFLILESYHLFTNSKKELLLITVLIFNTLLVSITELLSAVRLLNFQWLTTIWGAIAVLSTIYLYKKRRNIVNINNVFKNLAYKLRFHFSVTEKAASLFIAVILTLVFVQGIIYPPNNWDSMTYHMARITSWVSHEAVFNYPTHILRQNYQPPFAEFVIMHFSILCKSDYFANTVQFLFLLFSLVSVLLITGCLGLSRKYKIIALLLTITIPEVILQSSSTQNDIVTSFFTLSAFYFITRAIKDSTAKNYLISGLTVGLGLLTKGTAYIFFAPILVFWGIIALKRTYTTNHYKYLTYFAITIVVAVSINSGFYYRNYKLNHNLLGIGKKESVQYANQKMSPGLLLSSIIKNAGLHMGMKHVHGITSFSNKAIYKLHDITGVNINDPDVNFYNSHYVITDLPSDEDFAPNFLHLILITLSLILLLIHLVKYKINNLSKMLFAVVILQVILFCGYLKWQVYATRLHTPIFMLTIPLVCYTLYISNFLKKIAKITIPLILIYSLIIVSANRQRPYDHHLFLGRYAKFFIARDEIQQDYTQVKRVLSKENYKNVGLIINKDAWTYPLFYDCFSREINPIYINVENFTKNSNVGASNNLDCIITTNINKTFIDYKGKRYYNKTGNNNSLFIYR